MSTERMDPQVIEVALDAWFAARGIKGFNGPVERVWMEAALRAADEKRGIRVEAVAPDPRSSTQFDPEWRYVSDWQSLDDTQADPERQEYVYRVCWEDAAGPVRSAPMAIGSVDDFKEALLPVLRPTIWVERALLGTWERVER